MRRSAGFHINHHHTKQRNGNANGTLICRACAVIVISAKPRGEAAMIIVAIGKLNVQATAP
jgi:hypothetical protein